MAGGSPRLWLFGVTCTLPSWPVRRRLSARGHFLQEGTPSPISLRLAQGSLCQDPSGPKDPRGWRDEG